jgi:peptide/nickel transport system permease protein
MLKYFLKRVVQLIPVILGVTLLVFLIMKMSSGDPARLILGELATQQQVDALRDEMGLNDPVLVQYGRYIWSCLQGDFGTSYIKSRSVTSEVLSRFPNTMKLAVVSLILTVIFSVPLGIWAAIKQNSPIDSGIMVFSLLGISMPVFWLGLLLMIFFSLQWHLLPTSYDGTFLSYILPAACLIFPNISTVTRTTRSSMLDTIRQDYVRTARAKGCTKRTTIYKHAFRNAMIPSITVVGIQMGQLMGGSVLVEQIFGWPGLGRLMIESINKRDTPMVLGCVILLTIACSILNLIVDMGYAVVDPRIRGQYS